MTDNTRSETEGRRVMRKPIRLTGKEELPPDKSEDVRADADMPGLWLRLRRGSNGRTIRGWLIIYRIAGRSHRYLLGSAAHLSPTQARDMARKKLAEITLGGNPQKQRAAERQQGTLRQCVDLYLGYRSSAWRKNTRALQTRMLTGPAFKPLHAMRVDKITRADVAARILATEKASGSPTALLARSSLSSCLAWAVSQGLIEQNVVIGSTVPERSKSRERALDDREVAAVWKAAGDLGEYGKVVQLLILCGARRNEVGGLKWGEVNRDAGTITISASRSKNHRVLVLSLPPLAWEVLDTVPRVDDRDCLFGSRSGDGFTQWARGKRALDAKLGGAVAPFKLHDLRRSMASTMANLGVEPHHIEACLNHYSGSRSGIAGVYNRASYAVQIKRALSIWSDHIRMLITGSERTVLVFEQRANVEVVS